MEKDQKPLEPELKFELSPEVVADWQSLMASVADFNAALRRHLEPHLKAFAVFWERLRAWAKANEPFLKQISLLVPRIQNLPEKIGHIGELGWTVGTHMTPWDLLILVEINERSEADAYIMAKYKERDSDLMDVEARLSNVPELEPFRPALDQCFKAFRRGEYAITIPCLIAILERSIRYLSPFPNLTSTDVGKMARQAYMQSKGERDAVAVLGTWPLYEFVRALYTQYLPGESSDDQIFRKGILHGNQAPPDERIEVIRLFHAICSVTELYDRRPTLT
jgi:hypothetical protein